MYAHFINRGNLTLAVREDGVSQREKRQTCCFVESMLETHCPKTSGKHWERTRERDENERIEQRKQERRLCSGTTTLREHGGRRLRKDNACPWLNTDM
ncbi:hypothetical protein BDZ89DRAFT_540947 [Hymenopellis radicata]|nr:hypothetical protein BDZ89DRAFT_540947 [Hymenopellis radicata]